MSRKSKNTKDLKPEDKAVMPRIINVTELRGTLRTPILLHFTAEQWKRAIKNWEKMEKLPSRAVMLEAVPMPGGRGDMLVSYRGCPPGTIPIMRFSRATSPVGLTPEPDSYDTIQPSCIDDPDSGLPPPPPRRLGGCELVIRIGLQPRIPIFYCARTTCSRPRRCVPGFQQQPDGRVQFGCICRI